jgi:Fe(II)/alpha-ketoglutarate-dependent arginine beta-hydroxylase
MAYGLAPVKKVRRGITQLTLTEKAAQQCSAILADLCQTYATADNPLFLRQLSGLAAQLPAELRNTLNEMRYGESIAALMIRNGPVGEPDSPTPGHWKERDPRSTARQDFWLAMVSSHLGEPVGWASLQDGRIFNDILPISGEEDEQTGHGSSTDLELHVEDCFSDERCDALALLCLRNVDRVPNLITTAVGLDFSSLDLDALFSDRFLISPDSEHLRRSACPSQDTDRKQPLLFGSPESPYLRVDLPYTRAFPGDTRAEEALTAFAALLRQNAMEVRLAEGDLLVVDNYRALHGRGRFRARYDGTDRWMRKLTVVRDLRRSRGFRRGPEDRVIDPFGQLA